MSRALDDALDRARRRNGDRFDSSDLDAVDPRIREAYGLRRVEITRTYDNGETWTRRGLVGMTTGWRPAFILMARVDSIGSSDVLDARDKLVKIINSEVVR